MSNQTKYLSDGRKVVLVGWLNNVEAIVQEIFVTAAGDEIPSGERFVVKSLHDTPVKSYKDKELERLEKREKDAKATILRLEKEIELIDERLKTRRAMASCIEKAAKSMSPEDLDLLEMFTTGQIKWAVDLDYRINDPVPFDTYFADVDTEYGRRRFDGIKLLTLFGTSEGNLRFRVNHYRDGSGCYSNSYFFKDRESALSFIKDTVDFRIQEGKCSITDYDKCLSMGIAFSAEATEKMRDKKRAELESAITKHIKQQDDAGAAISKFKKELEELK